MALRAAPGRSRREHQNEQVQEVQGRRLLAHHAEDGDPVRNPAHIPKEVRQDARRLRDARSPRRGRRPEGVTTNQPPALTAPDLTPDTSHCDATTRDFATRMAKNAGLKLSEAQNEILLEAAPYAFAMAQRLRKNRNWFQEPANVFRT